MTETSRDHLHEIQTLMRKLTRTQISLAETMLRAMLNPVESHRLEGSDLVDAAFEEAFGNLLLLHHAIHDEPLNKASFEYALRNCFVATGKSATVNAHRGDSAWDVEVQGQRISCKTEAAKGMSENTIKIEKLMEARWIRECTNPHKCAVRVRTEIPNHLRRYDRILILRAFREEGAIRYLLQEPSSAMMASLLERVTDSTFSKEGARESYGADIFGEDETRMFRILLDSSVEKVRIAFTAHHATKHCEWRVSVRPSTY